MAYSLGGIVRLTYQVKDDTGTLANPSTSTLTITQPDGTVATPTVPSSAGTGLLRFDFVPTQVGQHHARWSTTGPTTSRPYDFVVEPDAALLVSVDEAIEHLGAAGAIVSDAKRDEMYEVCAAATDMVERDLGRAIVRRTVVETHDGGQHAIILRQSPVISITSVTASAVAVTDFVLDQAAGILYAGTTAYGTRFTWGRGNVTVTYVAGYVNPPWVARLRARQFVQALWQQSQTGFHPALDESSPEAFALPGGIPPEPRGYSALRAAAVA